MWRSNMLLRDSHSGDLVEVIDMQALTNPFRQEITIQYQHGQDLCDPEQLDKATLTFPSGEPLPRCWYDSHYRDSEIAR